MTVTAAGIGSTNGATSQPAPPGRTARGPAAAHAFTHLALGPQGRHHRSSATTLQANCTHVLFLALHSS
jgi:hypothetical protein